MQPGLGPVARFPRANNWRRLLGWRAVGCDDWYQLPGAGNEPVSSGTGRLALQGRRGLRGRHMICDTSDARTHPPPQNCSSHTKCYHLKQGWTPSPIYKDIDMMYS